LWGGDLPEKPLLLRRGRARADAKRGLNQAYTGEKRKRPHKIRPRCTTKAALIKEDNRPGKC